MADPVAAPIAAPIATWLLPPDKPHEPAHHIFPTRLARRPVIPFRAVNARGAPGHDEGLQRHHLLPRQLLSERCFGALFDQVGRAAVGFDDFRANGLLLPSTDHAARRTGMPLHRGPHRRYNEVVIARVGRIEERWSRERERDPAAARAEALMRLRLLQAALRRRLLSEQRRLILNRHDPLGAGFDFTELDAMAEALWASSDPAAAAATGQGP